MSKLRKFLIIDLILLMAVLGALTISKILKENNSDYIAPEPQEEIAEETEETTPEEGEAEETAETEEVAETQPEISEEVNPDEWNLLLVNPWNAIPDGYSVETAAVEGGYEVDARVADSLNEMLAACREAGCSPVVISAFRSHGTQEYLYNTTANKDDTAYPGTSEHECGLAVDILETGYGGDWDNAEKTAQTETQKWLTENCKDYGFILRYPSDKEEITGIVYESWHYRYVGREHAAKIMDSGVCLEEYLKRLDYETKTRIKDQ